MTTQKSFPGQEAVAALRARPQVVSGEPIGPGLMFKTIAPLGKEVGAQIAGRPDALAIVESLAADPLPAIRALACVVMGEVGKVHPQSIAGVAHRLAADDRWEVREVIANALDDQMSVEQPQFVYDLMARWVHDPDENVRRAPTNALMRYGIRHPRQVIALMRELAHDESEYVRKNVAFCLQQIAKVRHPILGQGLPDNPDVMIETLREWAADQDPHARWIVARTLGNVWALERLPAALDLLRQLASGSERRVQSAVVTSLKELARRRPGEVQQTVAGWQGDDAAGPGVRAVATKFNAKAKQ